jgi:hypothetical protein
MWTYRLIELLKMSKVRAAFKEEWR